jgi:hypothetical protein
VDASQFRQSGPAWQGDGLKEFGRGNDTENAMTLNTHPPDAAADDTAAEWWDRLESEAASLRADNAALRDQLTLRDQALDATPTFFVITEQNTGSPGKN